MKPGYKQTEVGVIPKDWNAVPLCAIGQFKNGINKTSEDFGHGSPFVNLMDVFGVSSIKAGDGFGLVETTRTEQNTYDLKRGDVLFIRSSVKPSGVGLTAVVEADLPKTVFSGFLLRFRDGDALDIGFKRHCFYAEQFRSKLIGASSVSANTNINQDNLKKLLIALPPTLPEQRAIAAALSDVDALLGGLDRLIAKKRDLKQAAMQQLLTGQTRLPGFSGAWEVKRLGEIANMEKGTQLHSSETNADGDFPHFNGGISASSYTHKSNTPANTIAISEGGNSCGYVQFISEPFWCGGHCYAVLPTDVEKRFLYHALKGQQSAIMGLRVGSGLPNVQKTALAAFSLTVPSNALEQTAIAAVLSDMDAELAALEARRDKTRDLKQAMMQELLTGKTRLVKPEAAHA